MSRYRNTDAKQNISLVLVMYSMGDRTIYSVVVDDFKLLYLLGNSEANIHLSYP